MPELLRANSDGTFSFQEGVLYVPLLVSLVCLALLACQAVLRLAQRYRVKPAKADSSEALVGGRDSGTVGSYYQPTDYRIRIWGVLRLSGVLGLLALSLWSWSTPNNSGIRVSNQLGYVLAYVYSTLLAFVTAGSRGIHADTASKHLSTILFSAWAVCAYRDILPLATYDGVPVDASEGIVLWLKLGLLTITGVLVPLVVPRRYQPLDPSDPQKEINPEQTAPILSMAFYSWLDRYILLGYRLPHLPFEELPPIADYDMAKNLVKKSFSHLDPTLTNSRRHLFLGILRVFWKEWTIIAVLYLIQVATTFAIPVGIYNLLDYLSGSATGHIRPIVWVLWLAISSILGAVVLHWFRFVATRMAIQTQAILTQLIFNHTLRSRIQTEHRPSPGTSGGKAEPGSGSANFVGKLTNLITTDLSTVIDGREFLNVVIYIPLQTAVCLWFLYRILGWSAFVGLFVILLVSPLPGYMGRKIRAVQAERMKRTDARVQSVTEVLNVIRMIKLFAWESKVNDQIAVKRQDELSYLMKLRLLELLNRLVNFVVPPLTMIATFATYTMVMKQELTAPRVFSSMVIFDILQTNLRLLFGTIPIVTQAYVSLDRVNDFMLKTELLEPSATEDSELVDEVEQSIGIRDTCFTWNIPQSDITNSEPTSTFVLRVDEELKFVPGTVNVVAGPSGSGKTSLLMALLGEMHYTPTSTRSYLRLSRAGGVAYAAQESWVLSGTIRENILFGSEFDDERYNETIEQCALRRDLDLFDAGDLTEVGERGITLSGGQKARITLARAVYSSASILLLDDVFAALDIRTGKHIVDKCLKGNLLRDRTVLLATHHLNLVYPATGYVVTLTANGRIESQGPPQTLAPLISQLAELVQQNDSAYDVHGPGDDILLIKSSLEAGKLTVAEEISQGRVGWSALKLYFTSLGGNAPAAFWFTFLGGMLATALIQTAQAWYLGYWARQYELRDPQEVNVAKYLAVYSAMLGAVVLTYMAAFVAFMYGALRASRILHQSLVQSVLGSTVRWLDKTPTSRIIARCTQDIQMIDSTIALCLCGFTERTIFMFIKFAAIIVVSPRLIVAGVLVCSLGLWLSQVYIKAQLSVQRETSNARAPVLSHFAATVAGLVSIRAYGAQEAFIQESYKRIDKYTRGARTSNNINRWIAIRVESIAGLSAAALAAYLVYWKDTSASDTGFSLTMAVGFSGMILWWVRQLNDFEVSANSLERIQQYLQIDHEPKPTPNGMPPAYWPASGELVVKSLSAKYSEDGPNVLHNVSFGVKSGERVGIVGRTGSGKSTLTLALLRCVPASGEVWYDGIRTDTLNLDALRTSITMIPQSPELLSGTIRQNLDPFAQYSDAELNNALHAAGAFSASSLADGPLSSEDRNGRITLDAPVSSGGLNYSVGQRQILALARAIVRKSKVLILDEATSSIDHATDTTIQTSLRSRLDKDVTLLIVAHRLQTVMDADKIMVLDAGHIVEFGPPSELLQREGGALRGLVEQSSDRDQLYAMARGISE